MYLHRKIDDFLTAWKKNKNRLPLIVRGAMQVGKTTSVLRFAKAITLMLSTSILHQINIVIFSLTALM